MIETTPINYTHDESFHNEKAALEIIPAILKFKNINSVIDIGCGTGSWLSAAKKLNIKEVKGVDGIQVRSALLKISPSEFLKHDLRKELDLNRQFDLCICLEVVEHLPVSAADTIIDTLTKHSQFIVFSAAIPGQTGDHHINEQWPKYWQEKFEARGYYPIDSLRKQFWNNKQVDWWYRQNLIIYTSELDVLNHHKTEAVLPLIHPELLNLKEQVIKNYEVIINDHIKNPRILSALKKVFKALYNPRKW